MAGVEFTLQAAQRIVAAVKKVEQSPTSYVGAANPSLTPGTSFWAALTGADLTGTFWDWVAVAPYLTALATNNDRGQFPSSNMWQFRDPYTAGLGNAREANGTVGINPGTVVLMTFIGYAQPPSTPNGVQVGTLTIAGGTTQSVVGSDGTIPYYVFQYGVQQPSAALPIHDHRDNVTGGGFAFGVYHPGTALPQQPWSE